MICLVFFKCINLINLLLHHHDIFFLNTKWHQSKTYTDTPVTKKHTPEEHQTKKPAKIQNKNEQRKQTKQKKKNPKKLSKLLAISDMEKKLGAGNQRTINSNQNWSKCAIDT